MKDICYEIGEELNKNFYKQFATKLENDFFKKYNRLNPKIIFEIDSDLHWALIDELNNNLIII
jgi:hypothetical protein